MAEEAPALATETPAAVETPQSVDPVVEAPATETKAEEAKPEETATTEETDTPKADADEDDKPRRTGSQRLKERNSRLAAQLAEAQAQIDRLSKQADPKTLKPGIDREPREDDFPNDYFAFQSAKTAWDVRQAIREENKTIEDRTRRAQELEARAEVLEEYDEGLTVARDRIPDFDKVLSKMSGVNVPDEVIQEITAAGKKGPLIAYHLAQNPSELARIAGMSGRELAREVGRLEGRVHLPQPKKATGAIPPLSSPKGGAAPAFDPRTAPMDEYVAKRKAGWKG